MSSIDDIRSMASSIRHTAQDLEHAADYLRAPKPDSIAYLVQRINDAGYTVVIWQDRNGRDWWATLSGDRYIASSIEQDPVDALKDALDRTVRDD